MRPALFAFLLHLLLATAGAVEMREVRWGFDGSVVPDRLNLLSVRLANPTDRAVEGVAVVRERGSLAGRGAPYILPLYLRPGAEQWLTFHVWIEAKRDDFTLECAGVRFDLPLALLGPKARVLLSPETPGPPRSSAALEFAERLFPPSVAATDALDAVALDHQPAWEQDQAVAFLDWIRRGGNLLLLRAAAGEPVTFSGPLAALNDLPERTRLGAGLVIRSALSRQGFEKATFTRHGLAEIAESGQNLLHQSSERGFLNRLASLTRPKIRWWLISLLTLGYLVVIGPLQYRLARRVDYRISVALFLGSVALFSGALAFIGRRGYGESQTVHSLAVARALGPGRFDVTQWISAFATRGAVYDLRHDSPANFYAVLGADPVREHIVNGRGGVFRADIPICSSRQFMHRGTLRGDDTSAEIETWQEDGGRLRALTLKVGEAFPSPALELHARYRDRIYRLERRDSRLVLPAGSAGEEIASHLNVARIVQAMAMLPFFLVKDEPDPLASMREALPLLEAHAVDGARFEGQLSVDPPQPPDLLQLWILAPSPRGFDLQGNFGRQSGFVLYVQDLATPVAP